MFGAEPCAAHAATMARWHGVQGCCREQDLHDRIVKAIMERNTEKAIRELEHHFDIQFEQIYIQNDENSHEHQVKPTLIAEDKRGDRGNI